jgi:hypothetical protein
MVHGVTLGLTMTTGRQTGDQNQKRSGMAAAAGLVIGIKDGTYLFQYWIFGRPLRG